MIRRYAGTADINLSASGSQLISGPSRSQQYVWTISSLLTKAECELIDKMFRDWDQARALGGTPAILVEDNTFGNSLSTYATFSTPPSFTYYSNSTVGIDFGLTEVK